MLSGPHGLDSVADYPALVAELLSRGVPANDVEKVCGGNLIRVMGEVERVAEGMRRGGGGTNAAAAAAAAGTRVEDVEMLCDAEIGEVWTRDQRAIIEETGKQRRLGGVHLSVEGKRE